MNDSWNSFRRAAQVSAFLFVGTLVGCGSRGTVEDTESGRPPRRDINLVAESYLRDIARTYSQVVAVEKGRVSGPKDLGTELQNRLKSPRDEKPFVIVWNVTRLDPTIPQDKRDRVLLAWEQTADVHGERFVLFTNADVSNVTVAKITEAEFKSAYKAKPNKK